MNFKAEFKFTPLDISRLQANIIPRAVAAITAACEVVVSEAQAICPVGDTGELVGSIHTASVAVVGNTVEGQVTASAPYASFVEFGTGIRGRGTYPFELPQSNVPFTGSWIYDYKNQGWIGHGAQPFMRPALDSGRSGILSAFEDQGFAI